MSDILIKNVDIPDDNPLVLMLTSDGLVCEKIGSMFHVADALWNEVPPHGRLIDADELVGNINDTYCEECPKTKPIMCKACEYEDIMDDIENAPTVLEANE